MSSGASLEVTIGSGAKAASGLPLAEPVTIHYQAAGPLRLAELLLGEGKPLLPLVAVRQGPQQGSLREVALGDGENVL